MENPEDKVLICRNPDCGRESCRLCKESNHVPLRCDEVEKTESTRKEIEEKLTEAMIRECWKCNKKVPSKRSETHFTAYFFLFSSSKWKVATR